MAEMLNVRVVATGKEYSIPDVEPVESARLFLQISDEIWRQKSEELHERLRVSAFALDSALPAPEAKDALNEVLGTIDEGLVISGIEKAIKLRGPWDEEVELTPELLNNPDRAHVGTFNWDERNTGCHIEIDGKREFATFTDGHLDYSRELYAGFEYTDEGNHAVQLTYGITRSQRTQDQTTSLYMNIWHGNFAETGYEGSILKHVPLSVEQELSLLRVFQALGGITLEAPAEA